MLALHALCAADASLAAPAADAQRFVRCQAPYLPALVALGGPMGNSRLSAGGPGAGSSAAEEATRRAAIEGLCLMAVLDGVLQHLGCVEADVARQMSTDLLHLINKQRYLQLLAAAAQLLCTLAVMHEPAAGQVSQLLTKVFNIAAGVLTAQAAPGPGTPGSPAHALVHVPRCGYGDSDGGATCLAAAACVRSARRNDRVCTHTSPRAMPCFGRLLAAVAAGCCTSAGSCASTALPALRQQHTATRATATAQSAWSCASGAAGAGHYKGGRNPGAQLVGWHAHARTWSTRPPRACHRCRRALLVVCLNTACGTSATCLTPPTRSACARRRCRPWA
jgi:hypothetical protein